MISFNIEDSIHHKYKTSATNAPIIAGIDEAGYGPWAGPVVAAAVILDQNSFDKNILEMINDSKKLPPEKRQLIHQHLLKQNGHSCHIGTGIISPEIIDRINILQANYMAMEKAVKSLTIPPTHVIVDGIRAPSSLAPNIIKVKKGDTLSYSIAAASIVAKVTRDNIMHKLSIEFPQYAWDRNSGYGTASHKQAINKFGITPYHRKSYKPIQDIIAQKKTA